jgi:lactate dehydrogenase-like 2-hydroxyacid dehydrogenase
MSNSSPGATSHAGQHEGKNTVVLAHWLPDWSTAEIQEVYDLRPFEPDCPDCQSARVVITTGPQRLDAEILGRLPNVEYIIAVGSGCEGIDAGYARDRGITISNSAIVTAEDVADHAVAITLALYGRILELDRAVRLDDWHIPTRRSLRELNVGIVGLGAIGLAIGRRMTAFGCDIRWTGPRAKDAPYPYMENLGDLAEWSEILFIAARADAINSGLIDANVLDKLGATGLITNVSRGSIIDEDALIGALQTSRLGGAALDVFQMEPTPGARWRDLPNVVVTPHVGGHATGVKNGIGKLIRRNLDLFFAGDTPLGIMVPRADKVVNRRD